MPRMKRRSKSEMYAHLVWATWRRTPWLEGEVEHRVHRCLEGRARKLGCAVLAVNGMPDHVHLVLRVPPIVAVASLARELKGTSSRFANARLIETFRWQSCYASFSLSRSHLKPAVAYVERQKQHHAEHTVMARWEEADEEVDEDEQGAAWANEDDWDEF